MQIINIPSFKFKWQNQKLSVTLWLFFLFMINDCFNPVYALIDLEANVQPFVLQTKKITIPNYPDAFNPSIVEWQGKTLMSFRARKEKEKLAHLVGFVWLDKNFNPGDQVFLLKIKGNYIQDPRLFVLNNHLYMAYSDLIVTQFESMRRMCIVEIFYDGLCFFAGNPDVILDFDGDGERKFEKNWTPFIYNNSILLSYTIYPHKVFFPYLGEGKCVTVDYSSVKKMPWMWGELRGGTCALKVDQQYLGFFHSTIEMNSVQSNGKKMQHYFIGAYTFLAQPPFQLTGISPEPIIGNCFYNGEIHQTWKPLRVVFPGGFIFNERYIWLAYGRQDHELWIAKLDKAELLKNLIPLHSNP